MKKLSLFALPAAAFLGVLLVSLRAPYVLQETLGLVTSFLAGRQIGAALDEKS